MYKLGTGNITRYWNSFLLRRVLFMLNQFQLKYKLGICNSLAQAAATQCRQARHFNGTMQCNYLTKSKSKSLVEYSRNFGKPHVAPPHNHEISDLIMMTYCHHNVLLFIILLQPY